MRAIPSGAGYIVGLSLVNRGIINATAAAPLIINTSNTVINSGTLKATSGGNLVIDDSINNTKTIAAVGSGATVTIEAAGVVSNTASAVIVASGKGAFVELVGVTVSGGTVEATSGSTAVVSGGTIGAGATFETLSGGTAVVNGTVINFGTLIGSGLGSLLEITEDAVVSGGAIKVGNGIVDVLSGGTADIAFLPNGSGGLEIADTHANSSTFTGTISGFGGLNHANHKQFIDLIWVTSDATVSASYTSAGPNGGFLTVTSGANPAPVAEIHFAGRYVTSNFHIASDIDGTVKIADPAVPDGGSVEPEPDHVFPRNGIDLPNVAFGAHTTLAYAGNNTDTGGTLTVTDGRHAAAIMLLGSYMAGSFAIVGDGHGGTLVKDAAQAAQPLLTHPPHG